MNFTSPNKFLVHKIRTSMIKNMNQCEYKLPGVAMMLPIARGVSFSDGARTDQAKQKKIKIYKKNLLVQVQRLWEKDFDISTYCYVSKWS
jgi:hypothetical protein